MTTHRCMGGGLYSSALREGHGWCSVCGGDFRLKRDGTLWQHGGKRSPCPGSGQPPKAAP